MTVVDDLVADLDANQQPRGAGRISRAVEGAERPAR